MSTGKEIMYADESLIEKSSSELQVFDLAEVQLLAEQGYTAIPLVEKLDMKESAGALYERLRGNGPSFLLESAELDERQGRYSCIGLHPDKLIRLETFGMMVNGEAHDFADPYKFVDELIAQHVVAPVADLPPMFGGAAGLFGYDLARYREPTIGPAKANQSGMPEMALMIPGITLAFDHYAQEVSIVANVLAQLDDSKTDLVANYYGAVQAIRSMKQAITEPISNDKASVPNYDNLEFTSNMSPDQFKGMVDTAKDYIEAGDVFQVVVSQRFSSDKPVDQNFAYQFIQRLKSITPSRYTFLFEFDDFQAAGCSPETLVKVTDGHVKHMAIAGTSNRGSNAEEDAELASELRNNPKERAEHSMLVDLSRNDVNNVCQPESVVVKAHAVIENYSHVMHMTTKVEGELKHGFRALDALRSIANAGTLSGAPKIRAMQIIDELEPDSRGFYGGAVGYVNYKGDLDSCIFIRSIVVDGEGIVHVQAGAGVVADSDPESEFQETLLKAGAPLKAVAEVCNPVRKRQQLTVNKPKKLFSGSKLPESLDSNVLLLDNYDSYTHNIAQALAKLGMRVTVMRNDVKAKELIQAKPNFLIVSPGPGRPEDAGLSIQALRHFPQDGIPSLGICLGHQALAMAFGGEVMRHKPVHGKMSSINHDGQTIFAGLPNELNVMRYHSLVAAEPLPDELERSAYAFDGVQEIVMALRHRKLPAEGVQFHPESFYTASGKEILQNFLKTAVSINGINQL